MNKDSKKKWRTYCMNTTRRDESKRQFYAEVKDNSVIPGDIVNVLINRADDYDLFGVLQD